MCPKISCEKEKTRAWFADGPACYTGTIHKWTAAALYVPSGKILKDTGEEKSSRWAELQVVHIVIHSVWKEKWPDRQLSTDLWADTNGLAGWSEHWKEHDWKIGEKDILGMGMWMNLSELEKDVKILISYCETRCWTIIPQPARYSNHAQVHNRDICSTIFLAALFVIVRIWKQPRCGSTEEWIQKLW